MPHSLLSVSKVNDLLARARQLREKEAQLAPVVFLANDAGTVKILSLQELAADAVGRRAQFQAIGTEFPDTTEAIFITETWLVTGNKTVDAFKVAPSEHPNRQEAIIVSGRNRAGTKAVLATQVFTVKNNRISWQKPTVTTKPSDIQGIVDCIFDP